MTAESIEESLRALAELPAGRPKASRLETLATEAAEINNPRLEASVLIELSRAYEYGAEGEKLPLAVGRLLRLADRYPNELGGRRVHTIYWQLKWMTSRMIDNPAVPLPTVDRWLDEFEGRYRQRAYSLRPVHADRAELALLLGDEEAASASMAAALHAPRDQMSDCEACERCAWGRWRVEFGDDEGALSAWGPVLDGTLTCAEEPHYALSYALLPMLRLGLFDEARGAFLRGYPMVKGNVSLMTAVGRHVEFCALTGNEARGLEILATHVGWLTDTAVDTSRRLAFLGGVVVLLRRLDALGQGALPVGGSFTVSSLLSSLSAEISQLCARYDSRNGNGAVSADVASRLAREPLVESLALGLPSRLPSAAAAPVAVVAAMGGGSAGGGSAGGSTLSDLIARARELDDIRHPAAEQAWARVGAVGGVDLPPEVAARVSEVAAFKLLADDPGVARKTLLDVAESYVALQDKPASFRARSSAARALAVTGDHAAAVAESVELAAAAEVAFATGELEPRHYLSVRMSEQMTAVYVLNVADSRTPAEIAAVVNGLTNALAVVSRYGDQDHVGRCHEMLAQAASWRRSQDELIQHLKAAHDAYLAAAEPWFAARPAAALAEFALQSGDAVLAESYAREALTHGVDVDPREAAMTASLLVETLTRQPDKALELADAALSAAARWEGISEPDTLHNTFNAARAYFSLGRHGEAAALFAEAMPRVSVPYDPSGIAMTREQYARSLRAIGQHAEAAEQFLEAARIIADDPANIKPQASLAAAAAESLRKSGQQEAALAAFRRAAVLFGEADNVVNRVRCLRSAAWLEFFSAGDSGTDRPGERAGIATMTAVLAELEGLSAGNSSAEFTTELTNTRDQLAEMVNERANPDPPQA